MSALQKVCAMFDARVATFDWTKPPSVPAPLSPAAFYVKAKNQVLSPAYPTPIDLESWCAAYLHKYEELRCYVEEHGGYPARLFWEEEGRL